MSGDFSDVLSRRLQDPPPAAGGGAGGAKWEDRHVRWTVWVDRDLRARIEDVARARDVSLRTLVDELLRAGLETTAPVRAPGRRAR